MFGAIKRFFIGDPLATAHEIHERLSNWTALAVFGSDALSSVAFATEEILFVLILAGSQALYLSVPVAATVVLLLFILVFSYNQTVHAYPDGGGAYRVASENLGRGPGLMAAAALLIDYTLNAAVCASAGAAALISALPNLEFLRVYFAIGIIIAVAMINLRGVKESGFIFAIPIYFFIATMATLILTGLFQLFTGSLVTMTVQQSVEVGATESLQTVTFFLLLRAFASGCTALTGVEAISNGVKAFKPPEPDNASKTLRMLGLCLAFIFIGVTFLAYKINVQPNHTETVISQVASTIYGRNILYYLTQFFTIAILFLSANTSFADFPRLSNLLAKDSFLPRQLMNRGDRLVFSNGIFLLAIVAIILIALFQASVHLLIPLFAVGVFLCFFLSDFGMVSYWYKKKSKNWKLSASVNALGAFASSSVFMAMVYTKFIHGAWIVILAVPIVMYLFHVIHSHYITFGKTLSIEDNPPTTCIMSNKIILLISGVHRGTLEALEYVRAIAKHSSDIVTVHIAMDPQRTDALKMEWNKYVPDIPLIFVDSPYRSLNIPLLQFIKETSKQYPDSFLTIVIPEFKTTSWLEDFLHNQTALFLKMALVGKKYKAIISYRFYFGKSEETPLLDKVSV